VNNLEQQDLNLQMESSQVVFLAKTLALQVSEQDWQENAVVYSGKSADYLTKQERKRLSLKTCLVYFPQMGEKIWPWSLKRWLNAGIAWDGGCLMLNTLEYPNAAVECSLSDVLETQGSHLQKYSLSAKAAQGILRRSTKGKGKLPIQLKMALENVVEQGQKSADN
jgi:hypothetical protein